jgi:hypothetical protein
MSTRGLKMILGVLSGLKTDDEVTKVSCALAKLHNQKLKMVFVITIDRNLPIDKEVRKSTIIAEDSLPYRSVSFYL